MDLLLVGNKIDLESNRQVKKEEGEEFAKKNNILFFETSAKSGLNVEPTFNGLIDSVAKKIESKELTLVSRQNEGTTACPKSVPLSTRTNESWGCYC